MVNREHICPCDYVQCMHALTEYNVSIKNDNVEPCLLVNEDVPGY